MIKIENWEVAGFEAAIRGMRNPMNSWDRSDSCFMDNTEGEYHTILGDQGPSCFVDGGVDDVLIGEKDFSLMKSLAQAGTEHSKYRRMIMVWCDITAPLYWWKQFDTYKVGTVANSCSTMHKIAEKEFSIDDFSHEHFNELPSNHEIAKILGHDFTLDADKFMSSNDAAWISTLVVIMLNRARRLYLETKDKKYWWAMIQLLPESYNQKRTVMLSYEVLASIYRQRKNHKLDEWHDFCDWIKGLPYSEVITLDDDTE